MPATDGGHPVGRAQQAKAKAQEKVEEGNGRSEQAPPRPGSAAYQA